MSAVTCCLSLPAGGMTQPTPQHAMPRRLCQQVQAQPHTTATCTELAHIASALPRPAPLSMAARARGKGAAGAAAPTLAHLQLDIPLQHAAVQAARCGRCDQLLRQLYAARRRQLFRLRTRLRREHCHHICLHSQALAASLLPPVSPAQAPAVYAMHKLKHFVRTPMYKPAEC